MNRPPFTELFGLFMPLFYLAVAAALVFTHLFARWVQGGAAYAFAGVFFLYGLFRIYRLFNRKP